MAKRVCGAWKGNNKFILGGRFIFGSDVEFLPITLLMIIAPVILFCVFVALHLRHVFLSYNAGYAVLVAAIIQTICVLVLLALTSARDPGIVPRNSHPPMEEFRHESSSAEAGGRQAPGLQFPRTKDVEVNGITVKVKYCYTCMIYRPPRCSHCSTCDNCVERFDHHCPWVGQCIGLRNYRFYFLFISSMTLLCIYAFSMSAFYIKVVMDEEQCSILKAIKKSSASMVSVGLMAYTFIVLCFVGGLTSFHLYLISTNQTTSENRRDRKNVFNHGCVGNFVEVFCTQLKPEEALRPAPAPSSQVEELGGDCCLNVEDDLDHGRDLQEISHCHNIEESIDEEIEESIDEEMHPEGTRELEAGEGLTSASKRAWM